VASVASVVIIVSASTPRHRLLGDTMIFPVSGEERRTHDLLDLLGRAAAEDT
jgi:hypothetical protein